MWLLFQNITQTSNGGYLLHVDFQFFVWIIRLSIFMIFFFQIRNEIFLMEN